MNHLCVPEGNFYLTKTLIVSVRTRKALYVKTERGRWSVEWGYLSRDHCDVAVKTKICFSFQYGQHYNIKVNLDGIANSKKLHFFFKCASKGPSALSLRSQEMDISTKTGAPPSLSPSPSPCPPPGRLRLRTAGDTARGPQQLARRRHGIESSCATWERQCYRHTVLLGYRLSVHLA